MGRRSWAAGLTAAAALAAVPATADAAGLATASAAARATTVTWSAVLADSTGAVQTGKALTVSWGLLDTAPRYASVRNNGTVALTGETYQVSATLATVRLDACVGGAWSGGTCPGSVVTLTDSTAGSAAVTRALAVGEQLSLRLTPNGLLGLATASVSVSVSRAQIRAATTSNA
ncbi:hypothetical protein M8542_16710 [Amycolatopsis sp. OK19-0408]|uniref:Uncharacterized protein n=1 Tax=Amycolatopsis iheyensis TaxID=2945988 RepID=A0A9X2NAV7_9PSEU|nr:hypothetical protein [Amycolatopsis iheyensis]MCR6484467.1 hypothetical protein [Amycolatopsis iheyensis]